MRLVELPSAAPQFNGMMTPHGVFLLNENTQRYIRGNTGCSLELYGFDKHLPSSSGPYAWVYGNRPGEVNEVATRVEGILERCPGNPGNNGAHLFL